MQSSHHESTSPYQDITPYLHMARGSHSTSGLLYVWINNFPLVISSHGSVFSYRLMEQLRIHLQQIVSPDDHVIHMDRDHFGIVFHPCTEATLAQRALDIFHAIIHYECTNTPFPVQLGATLGGTIFSATTDTTDDILNHAYIALSDAQNAYRHYVCFSDNTHHMKTSQAHMAIAHQIQHALLDNKLSLAFQPVIDRKTLKPIFYEALLRITDQQGNLTSVGAFIPAAEKMGFIDLIDTVAFKLALEELTAYPDLYLSVNVSSITLQQPEWINMAVGLLQNKSIASRLILEVTETFEYHELEPIARALQHFKTLGCRIALDDFGAGYTSMAHIHLLPIDIIKIDGEFVRHMLTRHDHYIFVQTIIELGQRLGLKTVAEFVENIPIAKAATFLEVDYMQGHCFANASTLRPWLKPPQTPTDV